MHEDSYSSTHPPLPPTTEDARVDWLRLLRSRRVGVTTFWRLMHEHGSAAAALEALPEVARAAGVEGYKICSEEWITAELRAARQAGARWVFCGEPDYPSELAEISDAPPMIWVVGDLSVFRRPLIALVGARNASSLGVRMARKLAEGLSEAGYCVVSGLARGIDTAAHQAALKGGTIAVLGGGVDVIYPSENTRLGEEIAAQGGARLSEQPMGLQPMARHFPMRNRLISGMSRATVVVEAAAKSGSLITARGALDQGREVLAVPGHPLDARAAGCNILIRDGARLVRHIDDIIEALPPLDLATEGPQAEFDLALPESAAQPDPATLTGRSGATGATVGSGNGMQEHGQPFDHANQPANDQPNAVQQALEQAARLHRRILDRLGPSPLSEDDLMRDLRDLGRGGTGAAPVLTELELQGEIQRQPGGFIARSQ